MKGSDSKPMRVLMVADHLGHPEGGVHGVTTYFVTHMAALSKSVDLELCFFSPRHPAAEELESAGVKQRFFGRRKWDARSIWDVARVTRSLRPDLIHLHGEKSFIAGALVGQALGVRSLMHLHDATPLRRPLRPLQRQLSRLVDRAVVVSQEIRSQADEFGFHPYKVRVLNYGIDVAPFARAAVGGRTRVRQELSVDEEEPLIGVIGRINRDKGQIEAIEAMAYVAAARPDAKLVVVGEGPGRAECEARVAALGLGPQVVFTGQRSDVPDVLAALDVALVPSMWHEAFGFVALEAIASGRPVIAFDTGGIGNTVLPGRTGVLLEPGDIEGLAREAVALLGDPERRRRYGEAGREHARCFSVEAHVSALLRIYDEVLFGAVPARRTSEFLPRPQRSPASSLPRRAGSRTARLLA